MDDPNVIKDDRIKQRADQLAAHGPKLPDDHTIIPQLHDIDAAEMATGELLQTVAKQVSMLAEKEVQLLRAELKSDMAKEVDTAKSIGIAGVCALLGVNMLLVALALCFHPAATAFVMGILLLMTAGILGWSGWSNRVRKPLDTTRQTLQEDVRWAKHRFT
jgi:uncharacterized membrane protein YqjE